MTLEKLAQVLLRLSLRRFPEVIASNWSVLVLAEVSNHFSHVGVSSHANEELLEYASDWQQWDLESSACLASWDATRFLDEVQKLARAKFIGATDGVLSSEFLFHTGGNGSGQVSVMNRLELSILREEGSHDLASHSTLVHVVNQVSGILSKNEISVKNAHLGVSSKSFLLGFLTFLNPSLGVLRGNQVVLYGANSNHAGDAKLLSDLRGGYKSVVLARGHREVVVSEVYNLASSLHANFETAEVGGHSLVELDTVAGELSLKGVHSILVGSEVNKFDSVVLSTRGQTSNDTLGQVVGTVYHDEFHSFSLIY